MTVTEFLKARWETVGEKYNHTIAHWLEASKTDLSEQVIGNILNRSKDTGLLSTLILAAGFGCTPDELKWIAQQKGDKTLWKLFFKADAVLNEEYSAEEQELVQAYRKLTPGKQTVVSAMIKEMQP